MSILRVQRAKVLRRSVLATAMGLALGLASTVNAQQSDDRIEREVETYRAMMKADPWSNPGMLDVDRGEALWKTPGGPRSASLEGCDLGLGAGKVDGAFAKLPRYFADADRVMDVEARILWCMEKLQGFDRTKLITRPHPGPGVPVKDLGAIATYVASRSNGQTFAADFSHPKEREALALGEALFFHRSGPMDFACSTCHADSGKRIRLQPLPFFSKPEEARKIVGQWPAYRVSTTNVMTMQHRVYDCLWQMRLSRDRAWFGRVGCPHQLPRQASRGGRDQHPRHEALRRSAMTMKRGISVVLLACIAVVGSTYAQQATWVDDAKVDKAMMNAFPKASGDWVSRLKGDATMQTCSDHKDAPPAEVARALEARERVTIRYPADGKLIGDWKRGEQLAQSGYGLRFTDYPPTRETGGNCYACHQLTKQEASFGTVGPSLLEYGKVRGFSEVDAKAVYDKIYNSNATTPCSLMPRFGANDVLTIDQIKDIVALLMSPESPVNRQ